jgi:enediyne biosynthesis protein E4
MMRKLAPPAVVLVLIGVLFVLARPPGASAQQRAAVAAQFHFVQLPIAEPPGLPDATIRDVNPAYQHIQAWISSVGAAVAINDFTGSGQPDDMCLVDTRSNSVIVTPVPGTKAAGTFKPFVLTPSPALPYNTSTMAPMGCAAGDFRQNGLMDLLVYYWGRTPVMFMLKQGATHLSASAYQPVEVVPSRPGPGNTYTGPLWNTNAVAVADFDGDGHPDLFIGNYFPDSPVLGSHSRGKVVMPSSLSQATNGGGDLILRWDGTTRSGAPRYAEAADPFPRGTATGWTLAVAAADLDSSMLPDVYVANDFGHDHLFVNVSVPGRIRFTEAKGWRSPFVPKSKVLGDGSFKGMGVDVTDLASNGKLDMVVSNITTSFGLEESNYAWMNTAANQAQLRTDLLHGVADYSDESWSMGLAQSGWSWDVKTGDFANNGTQDVVQTAGFVKGTVNRWPQLQEMATMNDNFLSNPLYWPNVEAGDDIAGHQCLAFFARAPGGRYTDISQNLGLCVPTPTRGVSIADTRDDGAIDFAVSRQWGPPAFYQNDSPRLGRYLDLRLYLPVSGPRRPLQAAGTPAIGAVVTVRTSSGQTMVAQVDGGSGGSGKNDFGLHFGLGTAAGPVTATVSWRGLDGRPHQAVIKLAPGFHQLMLDSTIREVRQ